MSVVRLVDVQNRAVYQLLDLADRVCVGALDRTRRAAQVPVSYRDSAEYLAGLVVKSYATVREVKSCLGS